MGLIEVGRVCIKITGREAGKKCVVVKIIDKNFVEITGPKELTGVRRRRVNIKHLLPLPLKVDISEGAGDEEVLEALKGTELYKEVVKAE
ncbi:MAG TPA: 50S ribosomal protein L14e [Candidatus Korarchaeota archaeon]|nr:50S ribosomal protein L14e [Candidatus Korarchaeota archaeon]